MICSSFFLLLPGRVVVLDREVVGGCVERASLDRGKAGIGCLGGEGRAHVIRLAIPYLLNKANNLGAKVF
jgi:hypothetical protein